MNRYCDNFSDELMENRGTSFGYDKVTVAQRFLRNISR
jgi:hypothetical protein